MAKSKNTSKPTLEDIAARSGVSLATVSRVINQSRPVSEELEARVKQAMDDLGFEPKTPKLQIIAIIVPQILNPFLTAVITGAQQEAERLGLYSMILNITENPERQRQHLQLLYHFPFDGIVVFHTNIDPEIVLELNTRSNVPIVVIGRTIESPRLYCISANRENAMYQAAKYLISLNHKEIAYISGPPELEVSKSRLRGIQRAFSEASLVLKPHLYRWCEPTIEAGFQVASSLLSQPVEKRPTAIIGFNDLIAIGALHAIRSVGLNVPDDVSVVGFDDIYLSLHTNPPLTTVAQPKYRMGQLAMQKIFDLLRGNDSGIEIFTPLECPLIVRESTAPCKQTNL
jgi:LacI family transcriptional regulator